MEEERSRIVRERIRGAFDRAAGDYARLESRRAFFRQLARRLVSLVPSLDGCQILDVGCGSGASLEVLKEAAGALGKVFGLDISLPMLREARRNVGDAALVVVADGCRFDALFRAGFDAVVYNAVLFLLPDASASLEAAFRILAPGGRVLIASLDGLLVGRGRRPAAEVLRERGFPGGRHAVSPWESVLPTLERLFPAPVVEALEVPLSPDEFLAFYSLEPMSAGLLPTLSYAERKRVLEKFSHQEECQAGFLQVWTLAAGQKRDGGGA